VVLLHRLGGNRLMRNSSPCAAKRVQTTAGWSWAVWRWRGNPDMPQRDLQGHPGRNFTYSPQGSAGGQKPPLSCGYIRARYWD
jgi:hypothetical protein